MSYDFSKAPEWLIELMEGDNSPEPEDRQKIVQARSREIELEKAKKLYTELFFRFMTISAFVLSIIGALR